MIGLGLSITQLAVRQLLGGSPSFSPASLFASSEPGVWYDPSDLSTLFQDSAGTTPVTAVEQPVGRMLDKSGRGNHAYQTTSTSRPVLSARYNLLTNTETLSTQSVTTQATNYTLRFTGTGTITLSGTKTGVYTAGTHTLTGVTAGTLTVTVAGVATTVDLRPANLSASFPVYQRVNTATDYDTAGFPKYLKFDGVDDFLVTNSIDAGADKAQVFAGVRKLSDAARAMFLETSTGGAAGSFMLEAPDTAAARYSMRLRGDAPSAIQVATPVTFAAPIANVISAFYDIGAATALTEMDMRINGADVSMVDNSGGLTAGTGNFLAYPLYIGRRGGTSNPFNGQLYSLLVRFGANLDSTTIEQTENWVNGKTLAY